MQNSRYNPIQCFQISWHTCSYCSSVTKSCSILCNLIDYSTPGSFVFHCLPEFAQIHVNWVRDALQPSHLVLPASPLDFNWKSQFLGRMIRRPGIPKEIGIWNSQGRGKDKHFFFSSSFLSVSHIKHFYL